LGHVHDIVKVFSADDWGRTHQITPQTVETSLPVVKKFFQMYLFWVMGLSYLSSES